MSKTFWALVTRDLRLAWGSGGNAGAVLMFFVLAVILFPLGVGPEPGILERVASGVIWVCGLFAAMLSLDRLFAADFEDGSLDQLALLPLPLELTVLAKILAHWLTTGLPLTLVSPLLGVFMQLDPGAYPMLLASLLLGSVALSLLGAVGAALVIGARRGGVLLSLLVLPLCTPVLIFGVGAIEAAVSGLEVRPHLLLLSAFVCAALPLCPIAGAAAVRQALE